MILIFDFFETILNNKSIDFNRGLKPMWEKNYRDKCTFEDIKAYGEELFAYLLKLHKEGKEFAFVKEELPLYAEKYGGEVIAMSVEEEADFLMRCNDMEYVPGIISLLEACKEEQIPMYVFVGDMYETDVKGASGAGISVAWINRKNESDEKHLATYSVSGMEQLQEIINSHFVTE